MRLKEWQWNRSRRKWELVETGEEFGAPEVVGTALTGCGGTGAVVGGVIAIAAAWVRRRRKRLDRSRRT